MEKKIQIKASTDKVAMAPYLLRIVEKYKNCGVNLFLLLALKVIHNKKKNPNDDFGCLTHSLDARLANLCGENKTEGQTQWLIS